jgi:hypothetical protein
MQHSRSQFCPTENIIKQETYIMIPLILSLVWFVQHGGKSFIPLDPISLTTSWLEQSLYVYCQINQPPSTKAF